MAVGYEVTVGGKTGASVAEGWGGGNTTVGDDSGGGYADGEASGGGAAGSSCIGEGTAGEGMTTVGVSVGLARASCVWVAPTSENIVAAACVRTASETPGAVGVWNGSGKLQEANEMLKKTTSAG